MFTGTANTIAPSGFVLGNIYLLGQENSRDAVHSKKPFDTLLSLPYRIKIPPNSMRVIPASKALISLLLLSSTPVFSLLCQEHHSLSFPDQKVLIFPLMLRGLDQGEFLSGLILLPKGNTYISLKGKWYLFVCLFDRTNPTNVPFTS